jgi:hypothetical protein
MIDIQIEPQVDTLLAKISTACGGYSYGVVMLALPRMIAEVLAEKLSPDEVDGVAEKLGEHIGEEVQRIMKERSKKRQ